MDLPQTPTPLPNPPSGGQPPHRHFMNMKFLITLVILIVLGGAAYASVSWYTNKQLAQENAAVPSTSPTPDPTTNWQTYINTNVVGYSLKYPEGWTIEDSSYKSTNGSGTQQNIQFSMTGPARYGIPGSKDVPARYINFFYLNNGVPTEASAYAPVGEFQIRGAPGQQDVNTASVSETFIRSSSDYKTAQQILSTFKFTNTAGTSTWKTYTNSKYNYSIQYPADWNIDTRYADSDFVSSGVGYSPDGPLSVSVTFTTAGDFSVYPPGSTSGIQDPSSTYAPVFFQMIKPDPVITLNQFIKQNFDTDLTPIANQVIIPYTINGMPAVLHTEKSTPGYTISGPTVTNILIKGSDRIYRFAYYAAGDPNMPKNRQQMIDSIVNSFQAN